MKTSEIKKLVKSLTLEEKAGLVSGKDGWCTKAIDRLGIPSVRTSDGPHGLRVIAENDLNRLDGKTLPGVCYPPACTSAASFDTQLLYEMGEQIADECKAYGVDVVLGPGVNIKRSPLCGRNFEYFSEDPIVAGKLGAAFVNGVQSRGIGTSLKHFFANSQEYRRMCSSSEIDERTTREIYLSAFEYVVKTAQPWTVMAAYNKVNGTHCTANKKYLDSVLRKEWGFKGLVMSDWGATHDRVGAVYAGCDLTMPAENTDDQVVEAVRSGKLKESALDKCCERVIALTYKCVENRIKAEYDFERGHALARKIAENSIVLLRNDGILPLSQKSKIAFIGGFAKEPRIQGGGSSHINCQSIVGAVAAAHNMGLNISFADGYNADGSTTDELIQAAVATAKEAGIAVLFIGLPDYMETEGVDRSHMKLPDGHNRLVDEVSRVAKTVVVLHNGSPVEMPWVNNVNAIVESYLGGEAVGEAVNSILFGDVNPSGRLAETFPIKLEDNPSYLSYFGEGNFVKYQEGVFVGYRYYTTKKMPVLFPFGYGLSYTEFAYSDLTVDSESITDSDTLKVSVAVKNIGKRAGKELVQLYVAPSKMNIIRPMRELKAFEKIALEAGESKVVTFELDRRAFAHYRVNEHDWRVESGKYTIEICKNAEEVISTYDITVTADPLIPEDGFNDTMAMNELARFPGGCDFINKSAHHLIRGMVFGGHIPQDMLSFIEKEMGKEFTRDDLYMLAGRGDLIGGAEGLDALFSQSVSIMLLCLPPESKRELDNLLESLNKKYKCK